MKIICHFLIGAAMLAPCAVAQKEVIAYIGTYTRQNSKGIYAYRFNPATGKVTSIGLVAETSNPSFLAISPDRKFLYAVNEDNTFQGKRAGSVSAFAIDDKSGQLKLLNQVSTGGPGPCHLALDKTGKWLFEANYAGGSVSAYPVKPDGSLGEATAFVQHTGSSVDKQRQGAPHAHSTVVSPDGKYVMVGDLGLDEVLTYRVDPSGKLPPADPPFVKVTPGLGPRHLAFAPKAKFAYLVTEMGASVTTFSYDPANGSLKELQTISMLPKDYSGAKGSAEVAVHPNGKFVYASNRDVSNGGKDTITVFAVDPKKGTLTPVDWTPAGRIPRNFAIDPTGQYLFDADQEGGSVLIFRIDPKTGKLTATGDKLDVPFPVCVVFR